MTKFLKHMAAMMILVAAVAGCASGAKGPSDEELITNTVNTFVTGMKTKDVDLLLSAVSENFSTSDAPDKASLGDFLKNAIDAGYLEEVEIGMEEATREFTDAKDSVYVYPLEIESLAGVATMGLTLAKEEGNWLIAGMDLEM
jgi:hypothetical protein